MTPCMWEVSLQSDCTNTYNLGEQSGPNCMFVLAFVDYYLGFIHRTPVTTRIISVATFKLCHFLYLITVFEDLQE